MSSTTMSRNKSYGVTPSINTELVKPTSIYGTSIDLPSISPSDTQAGVKCESSFIIIDDSETEISYGQECDNDKCYDDYDSDDEDNVKIIDDVMKKETFRIELTVWALQNNIAHKSLKELFKICNKLSPSLLPVDPRTLLHTRLTKMKDKIVQVGSSPSDGQYWHQGLEFCLHQCFRNIKQPLNISININIDGLPIFKSSNEQFWPILFNIHEFPHLSPMVIGIYSGNGKPKDLSSFITPFVQEAKTILEEGIIINDEYHISVQIRCFICDSPARAFIKGVAYYNGQHGCQKCSTIGEYSYVSNTNIFPRTCCPKRTNDEFRRRVDDLHHRCYTPLEILPINMIDDFIVAEPMHLIELGIMKRLLVGYRDGNFSNYYTKWSARDVQHVSEWLIACKMPSEMHRAVRGLDCLAHWKALEYRTFLYYLGIVILKDTIPCDAYCHFLMFFCAVTICSSTTHFILLDLADQLFVDYIEYYKIIYNENYITSNVHNLSHVVDDVRRFGVLSSISAYPFENKLFQIKRLLRHGYKALQQVANRISESSILCDNTIQIPKINKKLIIKNEKRLELENFVLDSTHMQNSWFLTYEHKIVHLKSVLLRNNVIYINGNSLKRTEDFFNTPIRSSILNIFASNCEEDIQTTYTVNQIKCKLVPVKYKNNMTVFVPLLHTL